MTIDAAVADRGIDPGILASLDKFTALRCDLHRHPELAFRETRTGALVAEAETTFAREVALAAFGPGRLEADFKPGMASEDFAYLLEARPGSYLFVGNGDSAPLDSPEYDFDDGLIALAARFWIRLARTFLA